MTRIQPQTNYVAMKNACIRSCSAMPKLNPDRRTPSFIAVMLGRSMVFAQSVSRQQSNSSSKCLIAPPVLPVGLLQRSNSSQICMHTMFRIWLASGSSPRISSQIAGVKRRLKRKMLTPVPHKKKRKSAQSNPIATRRACVPSCSAISKICPGRRTPSFNAVTR